MKETRGRKSRDTLPLKETQSSMTGVVTTKVTCNPHYSKEIPCNCLFIDPHYKGMPTATATIPCNCLFIDPHYKGMLTATLAIPFTVSSLIPTTKGCPTATATIPCNCLFIDPHYKGMPTATATIPCNCLFIDPHYKGMPTVTATIPCNSLTVSLQMQLTKGGKIRLLLYCIICGLESGQIFFSLSQSSLKKIFFSYSFFADFRGFLEDFWRIVPKLTLT